MRWVTHFTVAFGLAIRIAILMHVGGRALHYESPSYDVMGLQLLAGARFDPYWPPGLPYYLAFFHWIFGPGMLVARISMLLVYAGFSYTLYALVRRFASRGMANLAVLVFALYPTYVRWTLSPATEYPTAACLAAIALLAVIAADRRAWWAVAALGLVLGVLALVRPNSLGLGLAVPLWLWFRTRKVGLATVVFLVAAAPVSAWLLKAHSMTGRFVMINDSNAQNLFQSNNRWTPLYNTCVDGPIAWTVPPEFAKLEQEIECKPAGERDSIYRHIAIEHIASRPDLFLLRSFNRFRAFFCFPVHHGKLSTTGMIPTILGVAITAIEQVFFYWPIMVLAILFWFTNPLPAAQADARAVLGVAVIYSFPFFLTCSQSRYNFPVVPLLAVFAVTFVDAVRQRSWREVTVPLRSSVWRRRTLYATLVFFFYIQVEWIWMVRQAMEQGRLASLPRPTDHLHADVPKRGYGDLAQKEWKESTLEVSEQLLRTIAAAQKSIHANQKSGGAKAQNRATVCLRRDESPVQVRGNYAIMPKLQVRGFWTDRLLGRNSLSSLPMGSAICPSG